MFPTDFTKAITSLMVNSELVKAAQDRINIYNNLKSSIPNPDTFATITSFQSGIKHLLENQVMLYGTQSAINHHFDSPTIEFFNQHTKILNKLRNSYLYKYNDDNEYSYEEDDDVNSKVIEGIIDADINIEETSEKQSDIIIVSPINDKILNYLCENPSELYKFKGRAFEEVMASIYEKLGYDVKLTKQTRDGGKDIIITDKGLLGDFIYYVECKGYSANHPVGFGVVNQLFGTIMADRVTGGIVATTSFFTEPAKKFLLDKNCNFQMKLHDFYYIQDLLKKIQSNN